jgi:CRISPR-associated endonuclease Cas1
MQQERTPRGPQPAAKRIERRRDWSLPATWSHRGGEIVVVDGFGVFVGVERGRLLIRDGDGRNRRERRFGRAESRLARLVVLGGSGSISLDAARWLRDVGAALVCIDRDGSLMLTSAASKAEAKLRRAQALAPFRDTGLEITKTLLSAKLDGQREMLDRLDAQDHPKRTLERCSDRLNITTSIDGAVGLEAEAAAAYWRAWEEVDVRFPPADRRQIPESWSRFGQRHSHISGGPRVAVNPAGATLNYLYALLEAESRLACQALGLDTALAIVHADIRGRDSLPLDLMEAVRPSVDRYLLAFLRDRVFSARDFHETRHGNCRLLAPLTSEFAETMPAWRQLIAPVAEQVAAILARSSGTPRRSPTPLTQANRRADRAERHGSQREKPATRTPLPERRCKRCGGELPHRDRVFCDGCLPHYQRDQYTNYARAGVAQLTARRAAGADPSHGGEAGAKRGATQSRRRRELRAWTALNEALSTDVSAFEREILPLIQEVPLSVLMEATGLSLPYVSQIRRGKATPHPRHWSALRSATRTPPNTVWVDRDTRREP